MPKKNWETFFEFFSHRIIEVAIPVVITLLIDATLTRFIEKVTYSAQMNRSFQIAIDVEQNDEFDILFPIILAVVLIALIAISTVIILCCYFHGCVNALIAWMVVAVTLLLGFYSYTLIDMVPRVINLPLDYISLALIILNLVVVGNLAVFWRAPPIATQVTMVYISVLFAIVFLNLPDWTVWILLGILVIYDCCVVLCPNGLLNLLIKKSEERGDQIPALVYSAAAFFSDINNNGEGDGNDNHSENDNDDNSNNNERKQDISDDNQIELDNISSNTKKEDNLESSVKKTKGNKSILKKKKKVGAANPKQVNDINEPLLPCDGNIVDPAEGLLKTVKTATLSSSDESMEGDEKKENTDDEEEKRKKKKRRRFESDDEDGIKLGLGDFAFYGVLITRAARIGWDTAILCIFAVLLGLSITLVILAIVERPLPALPCSLVLGIIFYFIGIYTFRPFYQNLKEVYLIF